MFTTKEVAEKLNVTVRRVNALIASGDLQAEKFGNAWMIDERSVSTRLEQPIPSGRPKMGERNPRMLSSYVLMNRNHAVLTFTYNRRTHETANVTPCEGVDWKPFGTGLIETSPNRYDLATWISSRAIPALRPRLPLALRSPEVTDASDLMLSSWGLNLSDQYWFKPLDTQADWHELNYFENEYEKAFGEALLDGAKRAHIAGYTPDTATPGMLAKAWMRIDGIDCLVKGGLGNENREPYNEVLATKLLSRLLDQGEYVAYTLVERHGRAFSACPTMSTAETEFIPAADVLTAFGITQGRDVHRGYLDAGATLGISDISEQLDKMIVADHIMANFDRHTHNFGLIRDVESRGAYRVAPLFDNGGGFYSRATTVELETRPYVWEAHPFRMYPSQQLELVGSLQWFDPACLDGFMDDIATILGQNPNLDNRFIEMVQQQTAQRIAQVTHTAAERNALFGGF
ncbi:helix-turn-helix domain-containing protein [Gordonibacter sp.]|uniref:helix-turn-helix domain-containing protein n=1 Tax=Gordonibacter sp. TaxID=1968902 RepID=UPI002FCA9BDE